MSYPTTTSLEDEKTKFESQHVENPPQLYADDSREHESADVDPAYEKKLIRRVDRRLLIILGALYSVALIDRTNLSTARVLGMGADLKLTVGERYSIVSVVFFIPYIIFELPSNILLRKVGARNLLVTISVLWGTVMVGMAFVKTWEQLLALRVVLGFFESGFFPACAFLISTWYKKFETQKRMATFYLMSMAISGFSQIIGYGFAQIPPAGGKPPILKTWRYVFLLEGIITVALGALAWFYIVDFPDKNKFLSPEDTKIIIDRVNKDRGDGMPDELTGSKALKHLVDWHTWAFGLCFMCSTLPSYAFSYFLPVILAGAGYSTILSLMLSAPPYIAAAIFTFMMAYFSDRTRQRGLFVSLNALTCIVGCLIIGYAADRNVRYFGSFLAIMGAQSNVPAVIAFGSNNTVSHSKKAVSAAIIIGMGGVGGIFASLVYRQKDYPKYIPGLWATIGAQLLTVTLCGALYISFNRLNRKLDAGAIAPILGYKEFRYAA